MADPTFDFTLSNINGPTIQGTFVGTPIGDDSFQIYAVSGTVGGQPISGLSTFGGADNVLRYRQGRIIQTATSDRGIAVSAGGIDYRFTGNGGSASIETSAAPGVTTFGVYNLNWTNAPPICFVTGTRIRTTRGDVPVEQLRVGDIAVTASGKRRRIRWIGSRTLGA